MVTTASTPARVLVVDDEEHNRDMLARRLRRRGYVVETAASGQEALTMIAQGRYDIIVLDVMMPDVDGFEVLRSLRERWSKLELPVLMATALDASKDVVDALRHGANDYVTKPVDFEQLQARLETQLALRQEFAAMRTEAQQHKIRSTDSMPSGTMLDGRYEIEERIGQGGFAVVYRARQLSTGQHVAIKVLRAHRAMRSGTQGIEYQRFQREMQVIATIRHPAIVQLIDSGSLELEGGWATLAGDGPAPNTPNEGTFADSNSEHSGRIDLFDPTAAVPYFVMEYLQGETLEQLLARDSPLTLEHTLELFFPIISGVHALHRRGIVHRDLKPSNIFLHRGDQRLHQPKVLDFGIAKLGHEETGQMTVGFVGTPSYMSPEQALGERDLDSRCDQYALAVMLYECLSGRRPFAAENYTQVLLQVTTGDFTPLAELCDMPAPVNAAILKAMSRHREDRYEDLEQFAGGLLGGASELLRSRWASIV
jgi:serine/threonine protein kinase/FixJ family two-component response regulator